MMTIEQAIKSTINSTPGIKSVDLVLHVIGLLGGKLNTAHYFHEIERLVFKKEIVVVNYVLPEMNYRMKTMYFPGGTSVEIEEVETPTGSASASDCLQGR